MSVLGRVYCSIKARKYINLYKRVQHSGETAESLNVWESKTVLVSRLFPYILKVLGGGGGCLVLERSGLETVSSTLYEIQKKALLRQTMMSKLKVQLEILSSPIKLFL